MALQLLARPYRPLSRHSHLAWADNKKLYLWGGCVEGQPPGAATDEMHKGSKKMEVVSALEILDYQTGTWKREKIHGCESTFPFPPGIRDCGLALLNDTDGNNRVRPFVFGGYCGHDTCMHNSVHELCYYTEKEIYRWKEIVPNRAPGCPLKKRNAAAVAFNANGMAQVCVFAGRGPANSGVHLPHPTEYVPNVQNDELVWTNELHFLDIEKGWRCTGYEMTGKPPPPCWDCSFIKVSENPPKAVVFGGEAPNQLNNSRPYKSIEDVYILDLEKKEWSTIPPSSSPWPVLRAFHASCLIASPLTGHSNMTLLTMGGTNTNGETQQDMYLMDLTNLTATKLDVQTEIAQRLEHTITAVPMNESSVWVFTVGGVRNKAATDPTTWPRIQDDFILTFCWNRSQGKWEWIQSQTSLLSDLRYAQLRQEIDGLKEKYSRISQEFDSMKKQMADLQQLVSRMRSASERDGVTSTDEPILTEEDYNDVKTKLPCFTRWRNLGEWLGLHPRNLDEIKVSYELKGADECLSQVLRQWLKRNYNEEKTGPPTWSSLANAMENIDRALAIDIKQNVV